MSKYILLLILILCILIPVNAVQAQSDISISTDTEVRFPTEITFYLTADSPVDITKVYLRYRISMVTSANVISVVLPDFAPSPAVQIGWTWEMKKMLGSLPPGVEIEYSWRVINAEGIEYKTEWDNVKFDDNNHSWSSLTDDPVTIYWYREDPDFAQSILDASIETLDELTNNMGIYTDENIKLYIYANNRDLLDAMLYPQEWTGGVAIGDFSTILLAASSDDIGWMERVVAHELAHIVTYSMTYNPYNNIPTWLDEGISTYAEGPLRNDFVIALNRAVAADSLIRLKTLSGNFPVDFDDAVLSYAESYSVVNFLIESYGIDNFLKLLNTFKQGSSYDDALINVYGVNTEGLEDLWRISLGLQPRQSVVDSPESHSAEYSDNGLLAGFIALAVTGSGIPTVFIIMGSVLIPCIISIHHLSRYRGKK